MKNAGDSYIAITGHWIAPGWKLMSAVLGVKISDGKVVCTCVCAFVYLCVGACVLTIVYGMCSCGYACACVCMCEQQGHDLCSGSSKCMTCRR